MCKESLINFEEYVISKDGNIWSKYWKKYLNLTNLTKNGYVKVVLKTIDNKKYKTYSLHRVIWYFFNGEIPEDMEIGHKDCNTQNNCIENLYLCTHKENMNNPLTREKLSTMQKGEKAYWYGKKTAIYGKHHTEETKEKLRKLRTGYKLTDEWKKNISNGLKKHYKNIMLR